MQARLGFVLSANYRSLGSSSSSVPSLVSLPKRSNPQKPITVTATSPASPNPPPNFLSSVWVGLRGRGNTSSSFTLGNNKYNNYKVSRLNMSNSKQNFPAQQQEGQPGREHEMNPTPEFVRPSYKPSNKLSGKVAIVTGGDSGIGRSIACHYSLEGATVAITYVPEIEEKDASETLDLIKNKYKSESSHADPIKIGVDLGVEENCRKVVEQVIGAYGRIDILVNNAAEQHMVQAEDISSEQLERVFRTNIFSQFYLTKHALKHMKEGSSIINTTSVNAYKGNASLLDYTATKGAIVAFTRGLALQVVGRGIRVNGVAPGPVWTPLIPASFTEQKVEQFGGQVPMKRAAQPSEIGPSYVFLASEDSSYYTGQVLHPNGGVIVNA